MGIRDVLGSLAEEIFVPRQVSFSDTIEVFGTTSAHRFEAIGQGVTPTSVLRVPQLAKVGSGALAGWRSSNCADGETPTWTHANGIDSLTWEWLGSRTTISESLAKAIPRAKRERDLRVSGREALARTREVGGSGRRAVARRRCHPPAQVQLMLDSTILMSSESDGARYCWDPSDAHEITLLIIVVPGEDESGMSHFSASPVIR